MTQQWHLQLYTREVKAYVHTKNLCSDVYSSIIYSQKMEATQMSINEWMDKWNVYSHNGILFVHKKEQNTNICCNLNESWKDGKQKKLITEVHILYDIIHIKVQNSKI